MASAGKNGGKRKSKSKQCAKLLEDIGTKCSKDLAEMDGIQELSILDDPKYKKIMPKDIQKRMAENKESIKEAECQMQQKMQQAFIENLLGAGARREVKTDDGDQSPVQGAEAAKLKYQWASGMDWNPDSPFASPWMKALACGDYEEMMKHVDIATQSGEGAIKSLIERRETLLNFSALFHVVKGAMSTAYNADTSEGEITKHVECLSKLIDLGANIQARDFAGFTPLFYCVTKYATPLTLKMARILLKRGSDPNARNRLGATPIGESVMGRRLDCVKLLLDAGADPTIRDNDGCSIESNRPNDKDLRRLFYEARMKKSKELRKGAIKEAGGRVKNCTLCNGISESSNPNMRCTGCFAVFYCGKECQLTDWDNHKKKCKETKQQYQMVNLIKPTKGTINTSAKGGKDRFTSVGENRKPNKQHFIVKIQIPFDDTAAKLWHSWNKEDSSDPTRLTLYNQDKSVYGFIDHNEVLYPVLVEKIKSGGVFGDKGFFYAIIDEDKQHLNINPELLPPELW